MPSIYIRTISENLYQKLKARAKADRRSIQQEVAWLLEQTLESPAFLHQTNWQTLKGLQEKMRSLYGILPDSTPMIRQIRDER